jgi:hypothetical protein
MKIRFPFKFSNLQTPFEIMLDVNNFGDGDDFLK